MDALTFTVLYRETYPRTRAIVGGVCRDPERIADTIQEIYLAAWIRFSKSGHPNPAGWLVLTARHKAVDLLREAGREKGELYGLFPPEKCRSLSGTSRSPEEIYFSREALSSRIEAVLTPAEVTLVVARYEEQCSVPELCLRSGLSPSAVYMRLSRIRKKLSLSLDQAS